MKWTCIPCVCAVLLGALCACSSRLPVSDPVTEPTTIATQKSNVPAPSETDWHWKTGEAFSLNEADCFTVPLNACEGTAGIIAFWKDYLLIESSVRGGDTVHYYRYCLSTGELVKIISMPIYLFGTGKPLRAANGQYFFSYFPVDDPENLAFFCIDIENATIDLLEKTEMRMGTQQYLYHNENYIWRFWPIAEENIDGEDVYSYHIDRFDTTTGETVSLVNKTDSRKEGISCVCVSDNIIYCYVYRVEETGDIHSVIEEYSLEGELLKEIPVDIVKASFSDEKEVVWDISVFDNFFLLWTNFAYKCVVLEQVGDEFVPVDFPIPEPALAYVPPPPGMNSPRGYIFTDGTLVRYDKETRTFVQRLLPEHSKRYINEQGHLLITDNDKITLTCYLFDNLSW